MKKYTFEMMVEDVLIFNFKMETAEESIKLFFSCISISGLRFSEVRESERATIKEDDSVLWETLKGNNNREFNPGFFNRDLIEKLRVDPSFFNFISFSTFKYQLFKYLPFRGVRHGDKLLVSNFFRHYVMKEMYYVGHSVEEIAKFFGEKDTKNAENYIYSGLTYD